MTRQTQTGRSNRGDRSQEGSFQATDREKLRRIICNADASQEMVKEAERLGRELASSLSTSQIRSLFTEVRQIQAEWQHNAERAHRRLVLLKPKMAYRARKESGQAGQAIKNLVNVLDPAVDMVAGDSGNFGRFVEFFEAILAYHKAYGGN